MADIRVKRLFSVVKRGRSAGTKLTPHLYDGGYFVMSKSRFEEDYIKVKEESEILRHLSKGFAIRMSNPKVPSHRAPSLIAATSVREEAV